MGGRGLQRKDRHSVVTWSQASRAYHLIRSFCGQSGWGLGIELDESSALSGVRLVKVDEGSARVVSRGQWRLGGSWAAGKAFEGLERLWRGSGAALGPYPRSPVARRRQAGYAGSASAPDAAMQHQEAEEF
jgi:hypothetical protein